MKALDGKKIDPLFLTQCGCSNKCSVLVNHPASQSTLNALECSNWGAHLIEGKSTALGLLLYGKFSRSPQGWISVEELAGTQAINPKAMSKANHRLALFATPAHSVVQRSLANNFILSLNVYQSTYFGFTPDDINLYQQRSAKLILGRPWLAARYLPHISVVGDCSRTRPSSHTDLSVFRLLALDKMALLPLSHRGTRT